MCPIPALYFPRSTGNYISTSLPYRNKHLVNPSISALVPNGGIITQQHHLSSVNLPVGRRVHSPYIPLASGSLLSSGQLCDGGCTATQLLVERNSYTVLNGYRSPATRFCYLDVTDSSAFPYHTPVALQATSPVT
jgi:hypothetical protein